MSPTSLSEVVVVETPSAVMRTYASPAVNGAPVAVWRTEMAAHAAGPLHSVSETQVVVVLEGEAHVTIAGEGHRVRAGDSVLLPAGAERQVVAGPTGLVTLSSAVPGATARVADGEEVLVPWAR